MAGDKLVMPKNAFLMIHKPWSYVVGNANDMLKEIELLNAIEQSIVSIYKEHLAANVDTETMMNPENATALCIMDYIARKRGCLKKGGDIDYEKAAGCILDDFREGKIGRISLERV